MSECLHAFQFLTIYMVMYVHSAVNFQITIKILMSKICPVIQFSSASTTHKNFLLPYVACTLKHPVTFYCQYLHSVTNNKRSSALIQYMAYHGYYSTALLPVYKHL